MNVIRSFKSLNKFELTLWIVSAAAVTAPALFGGAENVLTAAASLIGVTALIFVAGGDVLGQLFTVVFSLFYAFISYTFHYYGEMITYLFMSAPIAGMAVVSWLRNPFEKGGREVKVNRLERHEIIFMWAAALIVTFVFYFILKAFDTANLVPSTVSVTTSFLAAYLTFRRSVFYALAYAANDIVLIVLWILAAAEDISYISMIVCFAMFLINDLYGFINWRKMKKRQSEEQSV